MRKGMFGQTSTTISTQPLKMLLSNTFDIIQR
jgi:hypothetical protein